MQIDFNKYSDGLVPAIIQDAITSKVLMLGFMNQEAIDTTIATKKVTFYSRTKKRLWTKGEQSNHFLQVQSIAVDCDNDSVLIKVIPNGPTCHSGNDTCWGETNTSPNFLYTLEKVIADRKNNSSTNSYVSALFAKGINKIAQKVGEEAVELVIESKDHNDDLFKEEAADFLILLQAKNMQLQDVIAVLEKRHKQ
jgi:phosphoribosyl-AMP cyclohydrolase / phosphoribosyl-ATP pyrophosphohydrolase